MSFEIKQHFGDWARPEQRKYKEGQKVECNVSAYLGTAVQAATLKALADREGFNVFYKEKGKKGKLVSPGSSIWTNLGQAHAT